MVNLKVGRTHAYQPYREVEPVPPYPRIDPQQPRDEQSRGQDDSKRSQDDHVRRRFTAMRRLIDDLKEEFTIGRLDYMAAEQEMVSLGQNIVDERLPDLLRFLKFPSESAEDCLYQVQQKILPADLRVGQKLREDDRLLPQVIPGLSELNLLVAEIRFRLNIGCADIFAAIRKDGRYVFEDGYLGLAVRHDEAMSDPFSVSMDLWVRVAACEIDEAGRKAILYQRQDQTLALYADKQINLSI